MATPSKRSKSNQKNQTEAIPIPEGVAMATTSSADENSKDSKEKNINRSMTLDGCRITFITIVYGEHSLNPDTALRTFHPTMCHQVFGPDETIYGYKNLVINLFYMANSARCYVEIKQNSIVQNLIDFEPIWQNLLPWLPPDYSTNFDDFRELVRKEDCSKVFGRVIDEYDGSSNITYEVALIENQDAEFIEFHNRFQTLIVWFIDAANLIDLTEGRWMLIYLYEVIHVRDEKNAYVPIGFCSIYKFFNYPKSVRPRISQFFIIPPCQRQGLGSKLLKTTYQAIYNLGNAIDISVEDPCPVFRNMRDLLDCTLLMQIEEFKYPGIKYGFTKAMQQVAVELYKINKTQVRRIYQILRMYYLLDKQDSDEFAKFRKEVHHDEDFRSPLTELERPSTSGEAAPAEELDDLSPVADAGAGAGAGASSTEAQACVKKTSTATISNVDEYIRELRVIAIRLGNRLVPYT